MRAVVLYSGGIDSTVLLHHLIQKGYQCFPLAFNYGQKHQTELDYAKKYTELYGLPLEIIDLSNIRALFDSKLTTGVGTNVVPFRNGILLSIATAFASRQGCDTVAYGATLTDFGTFADCRPDFVFAMQQAIKLGLANFDMKLLAPFIQMRKADIVSEGHHSYNVDFTKTWSCYEGGQMHCGKCQTCLERKKGFSDSGINDPTQYVS